MRAFEDVTVELTTVSLLGNKGEDLCWEEGMRRCEATLPAIPTPPALPPSVCSLSVPQ